MTKLLTRLFVRDYQNTGDAVVRGRYGTMVSIVCIVCNLLLCAGKFLFGTLLGSIAMMADAVNNLSDAGSSVVTLVSFRLSAKPADRDHPFGHARIEYVASMIVSFLILSVGLELFTGSIEKISSPDLPNEAYLIPSVIVLAASVLVKLWMGLLNRRIGRTIDSSVMRATAMDCIGDAISSTAVLSSTLLYAFLGWNIDAYLGIAVAVMILIAGCKILNETKNSILGEKPVAETVEAIRRIVGEYPEALGIHDLIVHNYGPGHLIASLHVEVDGATDIFETHDVMDNIERRLGSELGVQATIHADPIVIGDPVVDRLRGEVIAFAHEIHEELCVHDFRFVRGVTHSNLIFDIAVPFECPLTEEEILRTMDERIKELDPTFCAVIVLDKV